MAVSGETMNKGGRKGSPVHKAKKRGKEEAQGSLQLGKWDFPNGNCHVMDPFLGKYFMRLRTFTVGFYL